MAETLAEKIEFEGWGQVCEGPTGRYWMSGLRNSGLILHWNMVGEEFVRAGYKAGQKIRYKLVIEPADSEEGSENQ